MTIKTCLTIAVMILFSNSAAVSSIMEALETAVEKRREVGISRRQVYLTRWRLLNSARLFGPFVTLEYKTSEGKMMELLHEAQSYRSESYGIRFEQTIFQGGQKYYSFLRERTAHRVANLSFQRVMQEIRFEVLDAYYRVQMHKSNLENYNRLLMQLEEYYRIAYQKFNREIMTELDYMEIVNLRERIIIEIKTIEDRLAVARMHLKDAMGVRGELDIAINGFDGIPVDTQPEYTLPETIEIALENRPEVIKSRLITEQTEYDEKASKAGNIPGIFLEGFTGRSGEAYGDRELALTEQWNVFLNLQWSFWGSTISGRYGESRTDSPIFDESLKAESQDTVMQFSLLDGLENVYREREKEIVSEQSQLDLKKAENETVREVEKYYRQFLRAMENIEVAKRRLQLSRRRNKERDKKRLLGEVSLQAVADSLRETARIEGSLYENIYTYYISAAILNRLCGKEIF